MSKSIKQIVDESATLQDVLNELSKKYDTNIKLGVVTRLLIINGLSKIVSVLNLKEKK